MTSTASHFETMRLRKVKNSRIYLITGEQNNAPVWCYLCVHPGKEALLEQAAKAGTFDTGKYGMILYRGDGHEPPEMFKSMVERLKA